MRRILSLVVAMLVMAALLAMSAAVAFADPPPFTGGGSQGEGSFVVHCEEAFGSEFEGGNQAVSPSGNNNLHCFTERPPEGGSTGEGAEVFHCESIGFEGGNTVITPSGNGNLHCRV